MMIFGLVAANIEGTMANTMKNRRINSPPAISECDRSSNNGDRGSLCLLLSDAAKKALKDCVSSVAIAKFIHEQKYLVLKNKYLELFGSPDPLKTPARSVELPPEYTTDSDLHEVTEHLNSSIEVEKVDEKDKDVARPGLTRESWQPWTGLGQLTPLSQRWSTDSPPSTTKPDSTDVPAMLPFDEVSCKPTTTTTTVDTMSDIDITLPAVENKDIDDSEPVATTGVISPQECEPPSSTEVFAASECTDVKEGTIIVANRADAASCESNKENEPVEEQTLTQKISVKNLTKKFNDVDIESTNSDTSPDNKFDDMDGDSQSYTASIELDPLEKEWMLKCAICDVSELRRLYKGDNTLVRKKDFTNGYTALHWAAKHGSKEGVAFLCSTEMDVNMKSHGGYTPLHLACQQCHDDIIQILVKCYDADVNIRDNYGIKPQLLNKSSSAAQNMLQALQKDMYIIKLINKKPSLYSSLGKPDPLDTHTELLSDGNINMRRMSQHRKSKDFEGEGFVMPRKSKKLKGSKRFSLDLYSDKVDF